jgi:glucosylceramidase
MLKSSSCIIVLAATLVSINANSASVKWIQSGWDAKTNSVVNWHQNAEPKITDRDSSDYRVFDLNTSSTLQTIDGFGGAFNEKGWDAMSGMKPDERDNVIKNLFSQDGLNLTMGRIPIGANDYSMDYYSLDDTPGDYALKYFSMEREHKYLLPYLKSAMKYKPNLKVIASPWTPPAWMKANNFYGCRGSEENAHLIWDKKTQIAYAKYLSKFATEYQKEGVNLDQIHLQNEPAACQDFPSSKWTGTEMRDFLRDYLVPQFEKDKQSASIWLGTINYGDYKAYAEPVLTDPKLEGKIAGVGYQWDGKYAISETHKRHPDIKLMQTESECGDGKNDIFAGLYTFNLIKQYLAGGASSYVYWNMVLDSSGNSTWGWKQNSLINIDRMQGGKPQYNFEYYVIKHFSNLIKTGAKLLSVDINEDTLAFENPDKSIVVVSGNPSYSEKEMTFTIKNKMFKAKLPMMTINSFVVSQ